MRLINADEIVKVAEHAYNEWNLAMVGADTNRKVNLVYKLQELCKAIKAVADSMPTVDAAPVVRCKSCGKSAVTEMGKRFCNEPLGSRGSVQVEDDDFCSRGQRREAPDAQ
jgi:hypothetical protein